MPTKRRQKQTASQLHAVCRLLHTRRQTGPRAVMRTAARPASLPSLHLQARCQRLVIQGCMLVFRRTAALKRPQCTPPQLAHPGAVAHGARIHAVDDCGRAQEAHAVGEPSRRMDQLGARRR